MLTSILNFQKCQTSVMKRRKLMSKVIKEGYERLMKQLNKNTIDSLNSLSIVFKNKCNKILQKCCVFKQIVV